LNDPVVEQYKRGFQEDFLRIIHGKRRAPLKNKFSPFLNRSNSSLATTKEKLDIVNP